jgi:hypothetical protein
MEVETTRIQLTETPSFDNKHIIAVREVSDAGKQDFFLSSTLISESISQPPTLVNSGERRLGHREAHGLMKSIERLSLSLMPEVTVIGYDGTEWELIVARGANRITLQWWGDLPPEWQSLQSVVREMKYLARAQTEPNWWQIWR